MVHFIRKEDFPRQIVDNVEASTIRRTNNFVTVFLKTLRSNVDDWSNNIISAALKGLQSLNRTYKYAITVIIMQKNGAGLVSAVSSYWDPSVDGLCKVVWENGTIQCIVTVYGTCVNVPSSKVGVDDDDA